MYVVRIKTDFSAAHHLREIGGRCETLHGHNFAVEVMVESPALDDCGVVIDFRILKAKTRAVLEKLDHQYLNELPMFQGLNPSAEHIAAFIFHELSREINQGARRLAQVSVWESESSQATYFGPVQ